MADTTIEWATKVWNPTTGCDKVSPGCGKPRENAPNETHSVCYALTLAKRLKGMERARIAKGKLDPVAAKYQTDGDPRTSGPGFGIAMHDAALGVPFGWRKPERVFVNSMSDLFHPHVTPQFVGRVWAVMALTPHNTYKVLTKRPQRMPRILGVPDWTKHVNAGIRWVVDNTNGPIPAAVFDAAQQWLGSTTYANEVLPPLPNVWIGASVEDQRRADERISALLATPAALWWLSCEPLLGSVLLCRCDGAAYEVKRHPFLVNGDCPLHGATRIGWVVAGGESGPGARSMDLAWARSLRDQCTTAGVPPFVKQLGAAWARDNGGPPKGDDPDFWPMDLRVRKYPNATEHAGTVMT